MTRYFCTTSSRSFLVDPGRLPGISKWWMTLIVVIVVVSETKSAGNATGLPGDFHVDPATGRIHDSFGRERIFHGLNVVVKGAPWHPLIDKFDPQLSFTDADVLLLKELGMNVVRLGIMWPGVEPNRGHVNSTYLEIMKSIVANLFSAGIYSLLEFHQDLYTSQFCGEGLPSWILDDYDLNFAQQHSLQKQNASDSSFPETPAGTTALKSSDQSRKTERSKHHVQSRKEDPNETPKSVGQIARTERSKYDVQSRPEEGKETLPNSSSGDSIRGIPKLPRHRSLQQLQAPRYSKLQSKLSYPASFPEPLGRRWPWPSEWEQDGWEPSAESCSKHTWWSYYLSYAVSRAFQDLYDNNWGWGDLLARYWTLVAGAFKDQPGVLGYELMNEPWPGDVFQNPLLFLPGVADAKNLVHFYEKLQAAVRSVDNEKIIFFETITFDNFWCGFSTVPGGEEWQNKTVLSYHYYTPPNFTAKTAFAERLKESKRLGCGSMLTEFFVSNEQNNGNQRKFWKIKRDFLRKTGVSEDANQELRAGMEIVLCDPASKDSPDERCKLKIHSIAGDFKVHHGPKHRDVKGVREQLTEVSDNYAWGRDKEFKPLAIEKLEKRQKELEKVEEDTEENVFTGVDERLEKADSVDEVLFEADVNVQSWIGWEYKAFVTKTGSIVEQSLFNYDGEVNLILAKKLARTYPQSVCGNIISFSFDPLSSLFSLSYLAGGECSDGDQKFAFTEIFVHRQFYYPHGLSAEASQTCASVSESDRIILVKHTVDCVGLIIDVRISGGDRVT